MTEKRYTVVGMTCEHCVRAVREEVLDVDGVDAVDVDLALGSLRVQGEDVSDAAVSAAVVDAGYKLAAT
jgi:copper chaperone CopZ